MDLSKEFAEIQAKVDKLQEVADLQISAPIKLLPYTPRDAEDLRWTAFGNISYRCYDYSIENYFWRRDGWGRKEVVTKESLEKVLERFDNVTQKWIERNTDIHKQNLDAIAHNQLQVSRVYTIMETLGIRHEYKEYGLKTPRHRNTTLLTKHAGFKGDLARVIQTDSGYDKILRDIKKKRDNLETFGNNWIAKNAERIREEEAQEKLEKLESKKLQVLATLRVKYDLELDDEVEDILTAIISEDRYLYLGHYLEKNRGDWNDGCNYADQGLSGFTIETGQDKLVYESLVVYCDNWGGDGRVFRDCEFSYDYCFAQVDKKLMADYTAINEYIEG